jgi:hypothetical protein
MIVYNCLKEVIILNYGSVSTLALPFLPVLIALLVINDTCMGWVSRIQKFSKLPCFVQRFFIKLN